MYSPTEAEIDSARRIIRHKFRGYRHDIKEELEAEGMLGLAKAASMYTPNGVPFMGYALPRITGSVLDALRLYPVDGRKMLRNWKHGKENRFVEITYLDDDKDSEAKRLADGLDPLDYALAEERKQAVRKLLGCLTPRQREAVELFYLLEMENKREVGELMGVSPSRVNHLLTSARKRMLRFAGTERANPSISSKTV